MFFTNTYLEAKERLSEVLSTEGVVIKNFGEDMSLRCVVDSFFIEEEEFETRYANLTLILRYLIPTQQEIITKDRKLRVLANTGDTKWTKRLKALVWEGMYPDTVAIDMDSNEVFLVGVTERGVHLVLFNTLEGIDAQTLLENIEDREPYHIRIDERAMYEVLDNSEGYRHLFRNVQVVLHGHVDYIVRSSLVL